MAHANIGSLFLFFSRVLGAVAYISAFFGAGTGPIVMDDVRCTLSERRLVDCPLDLNHNCYHFEDAGVQCYSTTYGMYHKVVYPGIYVQPGVDKDW